MQLLPSDHWYPCPSEEEIKSFKINIDKYGLCEHNTILPLDIRHGACCLHAPRNRSLTALT
jgi:hypothetical protein